MNGNNRKLKVFISYASEDRPAATLLRELILTDGHEPWYDQDILPGKQWEKEIERNLEDADVVVIILSNSSVKKRGLVQREAARAVAKLDDLLDTDIYILPIRIDDCEPPERISTKIQFIDFNRQDAKSRISTSLRIAAHDRGIKSSGHVKVGPFAIEQLALKDSAPGKDGYANTFEFPKLVSTDFSHIADELTEYFAARAIVRKYESRPKQDLEWDAPEWSDGSSQQDYLEIVFASPKLVSAIETSHWYSAGAAHGNMGFESMNFLIDSGRPAIFSLESITDYNQEALQAISSNCIKLLSSEYWNRTSSEVDEDVLEWFENGAGPNWDNFKAFTLDPKGITLYFAPYQVYAYVLGSWTVTISRYELRKIPSMKRLLSILEEHTNE
ncbi:TIR domain-containing protein [Stenotrophomonas cyclobalanopsidis]|uniref:TIR domain-containing protein n=1 Tax=Stenotrophomonas cyclobalanopsidis TaxID=2771362 RepID=UPI0028A82B34|nr:TIR domain-containing protein [Stenotrophomonas cyclobalanopsidis]